ncbi:MAG: hypothetical protein LBN24_05735, partial [Mediterranea sp.]|nr:hypothetical protein [Mediterranea sp.]
MKPSAVTTRLLRKILLVRVKMEGESVAHTTTQVIRYARGKIIVELELDTPLPAFSKLKHTATILWITGDRVVSKPYTKGDPNTERILHNTELLWTLTAEAEGQTLSFLRKEPLAEVLQALEHHKALLVDTWIERVDGMSEPRARMERLYQERFASTTLAQSPDCANRLASFAFQKLFLPILLLFFFLLLGNFFLNSHYSQAYQQKQNIVQRSQKESRKNAAETKKKSLLFAEYTQIPDGSYALLADRIASYIPEGVKLTALALFPEEQRMGSGKNKPIT